MSNTDSRPTIPPLLEFSPGTLRGADALPKLLDLIDRNPSYSDAQEAIRQEWFHSAALDYGDLTQRKLQQGKRAGNVISGMRAAGLIDGDRLLSLAPVAREMLAARESIAEVYRIFVKHLLLKKHGLDMLNTARDVMRADGRVTKATINQGLEARGFYVPTGTANAGRLRAWLEQAGVVDHEWNIDEAKLADLVGLDHREVAEWTSLTPLQRAVLEILLDRHQGDRTPISSPDLVNLMKGAGLDFDGTQLNRDVYVPLENGGWLTRTGTTQGRGSRGGSLQITGKLLGLDLEVIKGLQYGDIPFDLQALLSTPTHEIAENLRSDDNHIKGTALELLSLRLASDIGLVPADLRLRARQTGGAEVDLVAEGAHLHFSRWLFQCKNYVGSVGLDVLAKEIGMAALLRAQVIVIVTTGTFRSSVEKYARQAAETTAIQVILIDRDVLAKYQSEGTTALRAHLRKVARSTLALKRHQLDEVPQD